MPPLDRIPGRLDRHDAERVARAAGFGQEIAESIGEVIARSDLPNDRRSEVLQELIAHFEDGLASGRSETSLLAEFGDQDRAATLIRKHKRVVAPVMAGGWGRGDGFARTMLRDIRYATRRLTARPGFTLTAILSLAIGIGANTAMFTLVNGVILKRQPIDTPDRVVQIYTSGHLNPWSVFSYPDLQDFIHSTSDLFSEVSGTQFQFLPIARGDELATVTAELVTGNYFTLLGTRPAAGRLIEPDDAPAPGATPVAVLSYGYWSRAYARDRSAIGTTVQIGPTEYTVIGVAPPSYTGSLRGLQPDLYLPITMLNAVTVSADDQLAQRGNQSIFVKARLRDGVTIDQARTRAEAIAGEFVANRVGNWESNDTIVLLPVQEVILFPPVDQVLVPVARLLMVVVGLLLVIACANLAGFLLARAVDRRKEIAVRLALGATRSRLVAQLLTETTLLALLGGAVGLLLGQWMLKALLAADLPIPFPISLDLSPDVRVLGFSIAVSIAAGILFGLAPAWQASRRDVASVIRDESVGGGRDRQRLRHLLVGAQVAVSVVLLVAAGLFLRGLNAARHIDPGFGADPTAILSLGLDGRGGDAAVLQTLDRLETAYRSIPGVRSVGAIGNIHLNSLSRSNADILVDGVEPPPGRAAHTIDRAEVDTGFFNAAGIRLLRGRGFEAGDGPDAPRVAVINEAFAERFWPDDSPIGKVIHTQNGTPIEVVGVVSTAKIRTLGEEPRPFLYNPVAQVGGQFMWVLARTTTGVEGTINAMIHQTREVAPETFILESRTMERHLGIMLLPARLGALALGVCAVIALILASVGLYGSVSYAVAQRSREVGIRLAIGADGRDVVRLLVWSGVRVVVAGAVVGLGIALVVVRLAYGLLQGVGIFDPVTFAAVPAVLVMVGLFAAYVPARRAGRVDPIVALRAE